MASEALNARGGKRERQDFAARKESPHRPVEADHVQYALGRPQDRPESVERRQRKHVTVPIAPTDLEILGRGELFVLRPGAGRDVGAPDHDTGVPAVSDEIDGFRRLGLRRTMPVANRSRAGAG